MAFPIWLRLTLALLATGCTAAGTLTPLPADRAALQSGVPDKKPSGYLYVMNRAVNTITVYALGSNTLVRTIKTGIDLPRAMAFDSKQNLYVANESGGSVTEYAPGKNTISNTYSSPTGTQPLTLAIDKNDNLFVADTGTAGGSIAVYAPGSTTASRTITAGIMFPASLTFDAAGNLYVANSSNSISVYGPGSSTVLHTITAGLDNPAIVAVDETAIVAANDVTPKPNVTLYKSQNRQKSGELKLKWTGVVGALAFTTARHTALPPGLLVANNLDSSKGSVSDYGSDNKVVATITKGIDGPSALAFDPSGNLYVANGKGASVTMYAAKTAKLKLKITSGISFPSALAFSSK